VFRSDIPKLPRALPRYLTPDMDRRLTQALQACPDRLPADALLLQRATGLRIGELVDLELDCVHEIPSQGAWLKVPLGKLNTERMVPLDEETVALIDRIVTHRSQGRPLPHPRTARPTDFLLTHHGRRLTVYQLRDVMTRVTRDAGLPHTTPHQLRHTYATALDVRGIASAASLGARVQRCGSVDLGFRPGGASRPTFYLTRLVSCVDARRPIGWMHRVQR